MPARRRASTSLPSAYSANAARKYSPLHFTPVASPKQTPATTSQGRRPARCRPTRRSSRTAPAAPEQHEQREHGVEQRDPAHHDGVAVDRHEAAGDHREQRRAEQQLREQQRDQHEQDAADGDRDPPAERVGGPEHREAEGDDPLADRRVRDERGRVEESVGVAGVERDVRVLPATIPRTRGATACTRLSRSRSRRTPARADGASPTRRVRMATTITSAGAPQVQAVAHPGRVIRCCQASSRRDPASSITAPGSLPRRRIPRCSCSRRRRSAISGTPRGD